MVDKTRSLVLWSLGQTGTICKKTPVTISAGIPTGIIDVEAMQLVFPCKSAEE